MLTGKNQSGQSPTAFGSMLQASTYGMTIPVICGRTISPLLAIWANNMRLAGSDKKLKNFFKKGGPAYCENIDFLIGKNPLLGTLQWYVNSAKYPLDFATQSFSGNGPWVITDPDFYAVIGVTITGTYSETFNDYGSTSGPQSVSGSFEIPLWNQNVSGPDPTGGSSYRNFPYAYRWKPADGATVSCDYADFFLATVTVHYAKLSSATKPNTPLSKLRLHWEARLGDGDEYDGFTSEQIIYDEYAGVGSGSLDLGTSGTIPSMKPEVQGKFGVYPSGDCDFVDIIEDIIKSGITQAAIGGDAGFNATQHGVGCFDFPGCIQRKLGASVESFTAGPLPYDLPTTAGNLLVVIATSGSTLGISDSGGNTWTPVFSSGLGYQVWYATAVGGECIVTVTGRDDNWNNMLLEVAGVDTLDAVSFADTGTRAAITTSGDPGIQAYLLAVSIYTLAGTAPPDPVLPNWNCITESNVYDGRPGHFNVQERRISSPGTFPFTAPPSLGSNPCDAVAILAFKCSQPPSNPKPLLDILDMPSLELTRRQCRAAGLWGSLAMNSQKACSDWIGDLVTAANCAPVWSGFRLKLIPLSEVSAVGNGAVYVAPTASGPVADLDADRGDFIGTISAPRSARTDLDTVLQMQHLNRNSDYQQVVTSQADPASIAFYGVRKKDPIVNMAIQDVAVAQPILRIMTRRRNYVDPQAFKFKLNARWGLLEAMDLVTITDRQQGIIKVPVRLKSVEEDDKFENDCEAEPFLYGISAPQVISVADPQPYRPDTSDGAGDVNAPVIFEPVVRLYGAENQAQLWLVVSSPSVAYGGCQVMISTDGGSSYTSAGDPLHGNGITGVTVGSWAAHASPDTTNDLAVDLTESLGQLLSYQTADEDNFVYPCYVEGTSTPIPYELMTYAVATLTAANKYTLKATGSGHHLNRGVFGAPVLDTGTLHASGSRFAFLAPDGTGILKLQMDPLWIGVTLHFKFLSFNTFGGSVQSLADVTDYTYTPTGGSGSVNPGGAPPQLFLVNGA
jgi:hypothetical protein